MNAEQFAGELRMCLAAGFGLCVVWRFFAMFVWAPYLWFKGLMR